MKNIKVILLVSPLVLAVGYILFQLPHSCKKSVVDSFYLNYDYETVRKTMVRTKAKERLIELSQGQIISEKIEDVNISTDKLLKGMRGNWRVEGSGVFKVRYQHPQLGDKMLNFKQTFYITPKQMLIKIAQLEPVGEMYYYEQTILLTAYGNQTRVDSTISIEIRYKAPPIKSIENKIDLDTAKGVQEASDKFRQSMNYVIGAYKDQNISIPFRL
jgi:hypothetical protein